MTTCIIPIKKQITLINGAKVEAIKIQPAMGFKNGKFHKARAANVNTSKVIPIAMNGSLIILIWVVRHRFFQILAP